MRTDTHGTARRLFLPNMPETSVMAVGSLGEIQTRSLPATSSYHYRLDSTAPRLRAG
jgi:hypothetical protein